MNDLAKRLLGSTSGNFVPRTPEDIAEARLRRHRAELKADRWLWEYEQEQAANIQRILSDPTTYSG